MKRIISPRFALGLVLTALVVRGSLAADAPRPSGQCLPDETVLTARIPGGRAFFDALRQRTQLGAVLLSNDRFERAMKLLRDEAGTQWEEFVKELEKYQLKPDDLPRLFDGELGFALVAQPRGERLPLFIGLTWAEPGGDLADRVFVAVQKIIDDQKQSEHAATRVDVELAGHKVMHLTIPEVGSDFNAADIEPPGLDATEEQRKEYIEKIRQRSAAAKSIVVDQTHVLLARIGNRVLLANTFPQSGAEVRAALKDSDKKADLAALTGADEVRGVFARFLAAHAESSSGGKIDRLMASPGLAAALPSGLPIVEVLVDPQPLVKLLAGTDPMVARAIKSLGVDQIGPLALRGSLDAGALRTGLFLSAPAPRSGLLALLDQPAIGPEPPAWVPASVMGYGHFSCDFGKVYSQVRELIVAEFGDEAKEGFKTVEQQIESAARCNVATLLSSLGTRHSMVSFPPKLTHAPPAAAGAGATLLPFAMPTGRTGIVCQLKDEEPWKRLIQLGAGFAALSQGAVKASEEQGFVGLRLNVENVIEGGVFVGRGHLILGIGPEVVEPLMASLRSPPQGEAALRSSPLLSRAATLMTPEPCIVYEVGDYNQTLKSARQTILSLLELPLALGAAAPAGLPGGAEHPEVPGAKEETAKTKALIEKIKALIPTEEELDGVMGAGVGQAVVNQHGLSYRMAIELPPAK